MGGLENRWTQEEEFDEETWHHYYRAVAGKPPRETLLLALEMAEASAAVKVSATDARFAIDLGCGEGRDTVELLQRGWRVMAIDNTAEAIARLLSHPKLCHPHRLQIRLARFEEVEFPSADLINASFCLPFCPPALFPTLWQRIIDALQPGGWFCGQLFGDRDTWAAFPSNTHHSRQQVEELLTPLAIVHFNEIEEDGTTALGTQKHWHVFHIVAQKR